MQWRERREFAGYAGVGFAVLFRRLSLSLPLPLSLLQKKKKDESIKDKSATRFSPFRPVPVMAHMERKCVWAEKEQRSWKAMGRERKIE